MEYNELPDEILLNIFSSLSSKSIFKISLLHSSFYNLINKDLTWKLIVNKQISSREHLPEGIESWKAFYQYVFFNLKPLRIEYYDNPIIPFKTYANTIDEITLDAKLATSYLSTAVIYDADVWAHRLIKAGVKIDKAIITSAIEYNAIYCIQAFLKQNLINLNDQLNKDYAPTYLHYAVYHATDKAIAAMLIDYLMTQPKITLLPPLHVAAATGNEGQLKDIIARTKDIDKRDKGNCTALWWALVCGKVECARLLIAAGANLNDISHNIYTAGLDPLRINLNTALTAAIWSKNIACLALVLQYQIFEIKPELYMEEPQTPLSLLFKADFVEGLEYLAEKLNAFTVKEGNYSLLHLAIDQEGLQILRYLLNKRKEEINHIFFSKKEDDRGDRYLQTHSPLMHALFYGRLQAAKIMLEAGADAAQLGRFVCFDRSDRSKPCTDHYLFPLQELFKNKKRLYRLGIEEAIKLTRLLLDRLPLKQKPTDKTLHVFYTKNYLQNEALFEWIRHSNDEKNYMYQALALKIIELLIEYGADIYYTDEDGNTALSQAEEVKNEAIKQLLLKPGTLKQENSLQSKYNATFFNKSVNSESIFVHRFGIGRIDLDIDAKPKELYITGLNSFIGIVVIGEKRISLINWLSNSIITPVIEEINHVGENAKIIFVRELGRNNDEAFNQFVTSFNLPNFEVIELFDSKKEGSVTVKSDKTLHTYPRKIDSKQVHVRLMVPYLKQILNNFQNNEADLIYDGKAYTPFPALDDKSYAMLNAALFNIDFKTTTKEEFKGKIDIFLDVLAKKYHWQEVFRYAKDYLYAYLMHRNNQLKILETFTAEGTQLFKENKLAPAKIKFIVAVKIGQEFCKQDNPFYAIALFHLATLFFKEENFSQALKHYQDCLTIRKAILKTDDPQLRAVISAISQTENKLKEQQPKSKGFGLG